MELCTLYAFLALQVLCFIDGYPSGAPTGACEDMIPRHSGVLPQPSPAPYSVLTNAKNYQPWKPITVTITGPEYRGVLLEARTSGSTNALGTWTLPPPDTQFLECNGEPQGAVTHSNTNLKGNTTVYRWIPPKLTSPVYFMATIAQQRTVFWINVKSSTLTSGRYGKVTNWDTSAKAQQSLKFNQAAPNCTHTGKPGGLSFATGASAGRADEKPLLLLVLGFLMFQVLV